MKYSELNANQRELFNQIQSHAVSAAIENDRLTSSFGLKALLFCNGTAILALASFIGALYSKDTPLRFSILLYSILAYVLGLICAGYAYLLLMIVVGEAVPYHGTQQVKVILDQLDIEKITSYGFSQRGKKRFLVSLRMSAIAFLVGIIFSIIFLFKTF